MLYDQFFIDDLKDRADLVRRISFLAILIFASISTGMAQNPPSAVLVDEFSTLGCDDFLARLDAYFAELRNEPISKGVVVIRNAASNRHRSVQTQALIEAHFRWRDWKQDSLDYVRADKEGDPLIQLWRLPPGTVLPVIEDQIDSFRIHEGVRRPFIMGYETKFGQICPEIDDQQIFAVFLKSNPKARGNIVVRAKSSGEAQRKAKTIRRKFETDYGISSERIRTFVAKLQKPENHDEPVVEYWYLP